MFDDAMLGVAPTEDPERFTLQVHQGIVTSGGALQGGAALGAAITAMARRVARPPIWATGHFLRHAAPDTRLGLEIELGMRGHKVTQASALLTDGDHEVMRAVGAFGTRDIGLEHTWAEPPKAPPPADCPVRAEIELGPWEIRRALGRERHQLDGARGPGRSATWYRRPGGRTPITAAELAIVGDCCAGEVSCAVGFHALCNSLDNTLRLAKPAETEWILLDASVMDISNGFAAVNANLWSEDGTLMATFSQSVVVRRTRDDGSAIRTTKHFAGR